MIKSDGFSFHGDNFSLFIAEQLQGFMSYKGIGLRTAATIRGEILSPDRFKTDGHLASYSGLVRKEHSTGVEARNIIPSLPALKYQDITHKNTKNPPYYLPYFAIRQKKWRADQPALYNPPL